MATPETEEPSRPRRPRFQFSVGWLLLITLLACVLAATWSNIRRRAGDSVSAIALVIAVAAPMGLMILLSLKDAFKRLLAEARNRRK